MIYLQNTTESQVLYIPKTLGVTVGNHVFYVFQAESNIDHALLINQAIHPLQTTDLYLIFNVELDEGLPNGEYNYVLLLGAETISSGLLVIGDYTKPSEYNKEIIYEQYETER